MKKLFILLAALFCFTPVWANLSPKPEMDFSFTYQNTEKLQIDPLHSEQIQCKDNQCLQATALGNYGIQKLYCTSEKCFSVAYEYEPYQQLIISFTNGKTLKSNIFSAPDSLRTRFEVTVTENALHVTPLGTVPQAGTWARRDVWLSLFIILVLEMLATAAFLVYSKKTFSILYSVFAANIITTAASWMWLAQYVKETAFLWLFCLLTETVLIRLLNLKKLSLKASFMLSLAMNVTSYSLGMIISFILSPLFF